MKYMSEEKFLWQVNSIHDYDTKGDTIAKLRWLQVRELRNKYPNDQDFGHEVAKLIMKDE